MSKDSIVVLTQIAWAAIVISAHRLSQGLLLGFDIAGSRFLIPVSNDQLYMESNFNTYMDSPSVEFWRELCLSEGTLRHFDKGDDYFTAGQVARYFGYVESGTLKYVAYSEDGTEHVLGLEFAGEFVTDFPFSFYGQKARTSVVAVTPCEIYCVSSSLIGARIKTDPRLKEMVMVGTEAVFSTVYDRYKDLYIKSAQQRYNELISKHPDLFSLFTLKDIASFLNITQTHLSRLRKNI